ncbi:MAG: hypothetical protein ACJ72M_22690 [Propionibacteriaceae bacterium]|jgi:hypothetical protein
MASKLRPVEPGERAEKPKRLSVVEAAAQGDHRAMLVALRDRLAQSVASASTNPVALAALSRQMVLISKELSVLDAVAEGDPVAVAARTPDEAWDGAV